MKNIPFKLYIRDLIVEGKHGVHKHEKETSQRFSITVVLSISDSKAVTSDSLEDTLNWSNIKADITSVVEAKSYNLIERLAKEVADTILIDKRVSKVLVKIDKIDAFDSGIPGIKLEVAQITSAH